MYLFFNSERNNPFFNDADIYLHKEFQIILRKTNLSEYFLSSKCENMNDIHLLEEHMTNSSQR